MVWHRYLIHLKLGVSLLLSSFAQASNAIVIVGDSQHPPFSYLDEGKPKGIYTDIVRMALTRMQQEAFSIELYPWKRAIDMVRNGRANGIFPPHYFPDKRLYLSLYSQPLMIEYASVFCNRETLAEYGIELIESLKWPEDLLHVKFELSLGVKMGGERFWQAVKQNQVDVTKVQGPKHAIRMVVNGRTDCHINDRVTVEWYLKEHNKGQQDEIVLAAIIAEEAGYLATSALWETKQSQRFINRFNEQISQMINDGSIQAIINRYIHE